jgi:hypothetical protein
MTRDNFEKNEPAFLSAAQAIADQLLENAGSSQSYLSWMGHSFIGSQGKVLEHLREDIYAGDAGIILFLLELYKITRDERLASAIHRTIARLIRYCNETPPSSFAFYTGRSGIAYVLMIAYELFGAENYATASADYLRQSNKVFMQINGGEINDLINGGAGLLLANLHGLAFEQRHPALAPVTSIEQMTMIADHLLDKLLFSKKGIYWDRSKTHVTGLCGMAHGGSGIGWVLAEFGSAYDDGFLQVIARQTMRHEDDFYYKKKENWADLRQFPDWTSISESDLTDYRINKADLGRRIFMHGWCHGAPGIGLLRLRFHELYGDKKFFDQFQLALRSTIQACDLMADQDKTYTLCHGIGGNAYLLHRSLQRDRDPQTAEKMRAYGYRAMDQHRRLGFNVSGYMGVKKDVSLFNGLAGLGYFYLQCARPGAPGLDILHPIPRVAMPSLGAYRDKNRKLFSRLFPLTVRRIGQNTDLESPVIGYANAGVEKQLISRMKTIVAAEQNEAIDALLRYELELIRFDPRDINNALLYAYNHFKEKLLDAAVPEGSDPTDNLEVVLCRTCRLINISVDGIGHVALKQTHEGLLEIPLSTLESIVCKAFRQKKTLRAGIHDICVEYTTPLEGADLDKIVYSAAASLLKRQVLVLNGS